MQRWLLEDRFKLAAHLESKKASGFALVVAKGGFKLRQVDSGQRYQPRAREGAVGWWTKRELTASTISIRRRWW
jgi:uncharacterized protein (TIGR03435 family)